MDMKRWYVGCLVAAVAVAILAGCSDGHGPVEGGGNGSSEAIEKIEAPLFVYEILAEHSTDSAGIDILDLLSAPRVGSS